MYLSVEGDTFTVKIKKKSDSTSFDELQPTLVGQNSEFGNGPIATAGISYIDNISVETIDVGIHRRTSDKLPITWGRLKGRP